MQNFNDFLINNYLVIKSFHVISMVAWIAAILYLPRLFVYHSQVKIKSETSEMLKIMEFRLQKYIMNPAMAFTILLGILLLKTKGIVNWSETWIYLKLFAVLGLLIVHHLLAKYRKDFFIDKNIHTAKFYKVLNEVPTVLLIIIILLVYLKPF
tara:strand:- start:43 stop:501 length:459 start_codon:yes stop_codon:yes gene_type:complete